MKMRATSLGISLSIAVAAVVFGGGQPGDTAKAIADRVIKKKKVRKEKARKKRKAHEGVGRAAVRVDCTMTLAPFEKNVAVWGNTDRYL